MDNFGGYLTPLGRELNHQYTRDQELSLVTRADGKQIRYNYTQDAKRKLLSIETDAQTISFSYVPFRALLQGITTNDGYTAFDYDGDAPISKNYFGVFNNGITMTYYQNGRLLNSMTVGGSYIAIAYNSDQEPNAVGELGITREQQTGLLTTKGLSSVSESFGHNTFGELESKSLGSLGSETYQRDNLGRIALKTTTLSGQNETSSYTYDPAGRLSRVVRSGTYASDVRYTYDARGNRIAVNRDGNITSGSYDTEDRLLSYGDLRFTYTDHGDLLEKENIVSGQKITLTYDQRGQLTRAALSGGRAITYTIDGEGRRLSRFVDGAFHTGYMHDTSGRLVAEVESSGQLRSHFVYATESHSPDYMIKSGAKFYLAKDQLGSIRAVINADTGVVAQAIHYDEFGRILVDSNPGFQPFGFAGGHYDHETGLVRYGARDYDAEVGRWLSKDPILFQGGLSNLYSYTNSDPVNFIDPSGLLFGIDAGESYADDAAQYWANESVNQCNSAAYRAAAAAAGLVASLWSTGASETTALTLAGAGIQAGATRAAALARAGWTPRFAIHGPHHRFALIGNRPHIQLNVWKTGVKNSGRVVFRIPLP